MSRRYFLIDTHGQEHLAAEGQENGEDSVVKRHKSRFSFRPCNGFERVIPVHSSMPLAYLKKWLDACMAAGRGSVGGGSKKVKGSVLHSAQGFPYIQYAPTPLNYDKLTHLPLLT